MCLWSEYAVNSDVCIHIYRYVAISVSYSMQTVNCFIF